MAAAVTKPHCEPGNRLMSPQRWDHVGPLWMTVRCMQQAVTFQYFFFIIIASSHIVIFTMEDNKTMTHHKAARTKNKMQECPKASIHVNEEQITLGWKWPDYPPSNEYNVACTSKQLVSNWKQWGQNILSNFTTGTLHLETQSNCKKLKQVKLLKHMTNVSYTCETYLCPCMWLTDPLMY